MGQQQKQNKTHYIEPQAVLAGLDARIDGLDVAIAGLMAEQHTLKRAREYILSTHDVATSSPDDNTAPAKSALKLPMRPTYPSLFRQSRRAQSSLRQEVLIRNAMEREKSSSPPGSVGLLSSDEFEASFPDRDLFRGNGDNNANGSGADNSVEDDVRPSIERTSSSTAESHSTNSPTTTAISASRSNTPSPVGETSALTTSSRNVRGAHWQVKRVTKRKLQENAAKAREVRRRKLKAISAAV